MRFCFFHAEEFTCFNKQLIGLLVWHWKTDEKYNEFAHFVENQIAMFFYFLRLFFFFWL